MREPLGSFTDDYDIAPVALTAGDVDGFYDGFANRVIWPLFHGFSTNCDFDPAYWESYRRVNRKFAEAVRRQLRPDDVVWVHDYHLMCLATELRRAGVRNRLGFFIHIPFPPLDTFRLLPWRERLVGDLRAFDLLGFQTSTDARYCRDCMDELDSRKVTARRGSDRALPPLHTPPTRGFPISIDFRRYSRLARSEPVIAALRAAKKAFGDQIVVLGVDRLDYSKGLPHKLAAFRRALEKYPQLCGRVTQLQHVVPSRESVREYRALKRQIERMVGALNGEMSTTSWIPVRYHFGSLDPEVLCAHYRLARVALVTSLRDGMNLVAKEYCAAQVDSDGTLVLSEFAGAAEELGPEALLINPYDLEGTSDALYAACNLSPEERGARMRRLRAQIERHDVFQWVDDFIGVLQATPDRDDYQTRAVVV
jgi:alpha,alpha-trehalose-phosphate synthase [UDP-forming]